MTDLSKYGIYGQDIFWQRFCTLLDLHKKCCQYASMPPYGKSEYIFGQGSNVNFGINYKKIKSRYDYYFFEKNMFYHTSSLEEFLRADGVNIIQAHLRRIRKDMELAIAKKYSKQFYKEEGLNFDPENAELLSYDEAVVKDILE